MCGAILTEHLTEVRQEIASAHSKFADMLAEQVVSSSDYEAVRETVSNLTTSVNSLATRVQALEKSPNDNGSPKLNESGKSA